MECLGVLIKVGGESRTSCSRGVDFVQRGVSGCALDINPPVGGKWVKGEVSIVY